MLSWTRQRVPVAALAPADGRPTSTTGIPWLWACSIARTKGGSSGPAGLDDEHSGIMGEGLANQLGLRYTGAPPGR